MIGDTTSAYTGICIELQYFPPVSYFTLFNQFKTIYIEKFEHFRKQSYRNRCLIRGANKIEKLIVPVKYCPGKSNIREVQIDYTANWFNHHRKAFLSAYGKSPFFEYFAEDFYDLLNNKSRFLFDLNLEILSKCLDLLGLNPELKFTKDYNKKTSSTVFDARELIDPKKPQKKRPFFNPIPYYQVFGKDFAEDLSIVDLLFCEGPDALQIIKRSATNN